MNRINHFLETITVEYLPFVIYAGIAISGINLINLEENRLFYIWWENTYPISAATYGILMLFIVLFAYWRREDGNNLFYYSLPMLVLLSVMIQFNVETGNPPAVTTGVRIYAIALTISVAIMTRINMKQKLIINKLNRNARKL